MARRIVRMSSLLVGLFAVMFVASLAQSQAEFSAEIIDTQKPAPTPPKIYFGKDKIRIESHNNDPRKGGAVIVNYATQTSIVVMDQQHMYMEMPAQNANQRAGYNFFMTNDVENACGDWQKAVHTQGTCHKVGNETASGRSCVKYEAVNASGETSYIWLDPKLRFPVKWQGKNSGGELRNIQEGSQPASLFEVPAGYTKFNMPDMGSMMQQHQ